MFYNSAIKEVSGEFPALVNADGMFLYCRSMTSFDVALPKLVMGGGMFLSSGLRSFSSQMPLLEKGANSIGWGMFRGCGSLTSFSSALPSLTDGANMFNGCKLDLPSVQTIARTIKDNNSMATPPPLGLGMSKDIKGQVDGELDLIRSKGWALMTVWY